MALYNTQATRLPLLIPFLCGVSDTISVLSRPSRGQGFTFATGIVSNTPYSASYHGQVSGDTD